MIPTTEPTRRLHVLFNRRPNTSWSDKEIKQYKILFKAGAFTDLSDLELIERYTLAERQKGSAGIHRRELITLLNNWNGELDRARQWNPRLKNRRIFRSPKEPENGARVSDEEFKRIGGLARQQLEEFKKQLTHC